LNNDIHSTHIAQNNSLLNDWMINYYCLSLYFNIIHGSDVWTCDCQTIKSLDVHVIDVILMRVQYRTCTQNPWHINTIIPLLSPKRKSNLKNILYLQLYWAIYWDFFHYLKCTYVSYHQNIVTFSRLLLSILINT